MQAKMDQTIKQLVTYTGQENETNFMGPLFTVIKVYTFFFFHVVLALLRTNIMSQIQPRSFIFQSLGKEAA